jgi:polyhydroxyalkanoate synthesis regulator phasin
MAKTQQKDILSRFQDLGAEALHKLQDVPGGAKLMDMANETKARMDDMQKKLRGLDALEKRVAKLEKQLAAQAKKPAGRKPAAKRKPAAAKKS